MKKLLGLLSLIWTFSCFAQQNPTSVFDCTLGNTQVAQSDIVAANHQYYNTCIAMGTPNAYNFDANQNHLVQATSQICLNPGFNGGLFNPDGSMLLEIEKSPYDVAVMNYAGLDGVLLHDRLELGVEIPENILIKINEYLKPTTTGQDYQINPYVTHKILPTDPEGIKVTCHFTHIASGFQKTIHGFHYVPYESYEPNYIRPGAPTLNGYTAAADLPPYMGGWTELTTNYPFRVRYAPPELGLWKASLKIETGNTVIITPEFMFNVIPSDKKPGLLAGLNKRYFVRDGKSFYPNGVNFSWPQTYKELDPEFHAIVGASEDYRTFTARPRTYRVFRENIERLADAGGNFFKFAMSPSSSDIEFEELGNYYNHERQCSAWEMDKILFTAEERDLLIEWNCASQHQFTHGMYEKHIWDWLKTTSSNLEYAYCYNNEDLGVYDHSDFFTNPNAIEYYKQKLRYITSRWGYSNNIAFFEIMMEIDFTLHKYNIGDPTPYEPDPYHDFEYICDDSDNPIPAPDRTARQNTIYQWHKTILEYLHNELGYDHRMYGVNYGDIGDNDSTFSIPELDVMTINKYNMNYYYDLGDYAPYDGTDDHDDHMMYRFHSRMAPKWVSVVDANDMEAKWCSGEGGLLGYTRDHYSPNRKIFMFGETGNTAGEGLDIFPCDTFDIEMVRDQWKLIFSGVSGGMDWNAHRFQIGSSTYNGYTPLGQMNEFINNDKIRLDRDQWHPGPVSLLFQGSNLQPLWLYQSNWEEDMNRKDKQAGMVYLRKGNREQAIGMVTSNKWNFANGGVDDCNVQLNFGLNNLANVSPGNLQNKLKVRNMKSGKRYIIEYYEPDNLTTPVYTDTEWGPTIEIDFPEFSYNGENYIQLFKIFPMSDGEFKSLDTKDSLQTDEMEIYPNPASDKITIEMFLNMEDISRLNGEIEIISLEGKTWYSNNISNLKHTVDVSSLPPGIYLVRYVSEGRSISKRLIIQ